MKALVVDRYVEHFDELRVADVANPEQHDDEVVVSVQAAGLNYVDLLYHFSYIGSHGPLLLSNILRYRFSGGLLARGKHQNNKSLVTPPFILGLEFAGVVVSAPKNSSFSKGDRVFGGGQGSFAEAISVKESHLHSIPEKWTYVDAAGLGATAPVSYGALILRGGLKNGETVLIHAASGGLGLMAVQIAKAVGAKVIATASSEEKLAVTKCYGAHECVNYTSSNDWWQEVLSLTGGVGVDLVFDSVGLVGKSLKCLKHKGRVLVIGFAGTGGDIEKISMNRILLKQAQILGYRYGESSRRYPKEIRKIWYGLMEMINQGQVKPCVFEHDYRGLSSVPQALNDLAARKIWGKGVVTIGEHHRGAML